MELADFFISYNKANKEIAEWIAYILEEVKYKTIIQEWDFLSGSIFINEMQKAATQSKRTIALLSQDYCDSNFTQSEWSAAFKQDPTGDQSILITIRIEDFNPPGILGVITYIDIVNLDEFTAKNKILEEIEYIVKNKRRKPDKAPPFKLIKLKSKNDICENISKAQVESSNNLMLSLKLVGSDGERVGSRFLISKMATYYHLEIINSSNDITANNVEVICSRTQKIKYHKIVEPIKLTPQNHHIFTPYESSIIRPDIADRRLLDFVVLLEDANIIIPCWLELDKQSISNDVIVRKNEAVRYELKIIASNLHQNQTVLYEADWNSNKPKINCVKSFIENI